MSINIDNYTIIKIGHMVQCDDELQIVEDLAWYKDPDESVPYITYLVHSLRTGDYTEISEFDLLQQNPEYLH